MHQALVVLVDVAIWSATLLPVRVDFMEVLDLLHKDEPFVSGSRNYTAGFHLHYTDPLQKFCNRASSGNPVVYNCSNPGLCGRKVLFFLPSYSYSGIKC